VGDSILSVAAIEHVDSSPSEQNVVPFVPKELIEAAPALNLSPLRD
jgi:hypothetical protein